MELKHILAAAGGSPPAVQAMSYARRPLLPAAADESDCDSDPALLLSVDEAASRALKLNKIGGPLAQEAIRESELLALAHPDDRPFLTHTLAWVRQGGARARVALRLAHMQGSWAAMLAEITRRSDGTAALALELDDAAAARRELARNRKVLEDAYHPVVIRVGSTVAYSNSALAKMLGYATLEQLRREGRGKDHVHPDDRPLVEGRIAARADGQTTPENYQFRMCRADGSVIWVDCFVSRVTWNDQPASLAWLIDITERKETEEALRRSEKLFESVFQASPAMLTLSRLDDGCFVDVNHSFLRTLGYERDAVLGRTEREIGIFVDHAVHRQLAPAPGTDSGVGAVPKEAVATVRARNGELRQLALSSRAIRFADRDLLLTVGRDVTERRRKEEELRKSKEAAVLANRAKSEFLANMSHELRTPLNAIIGFAEVLAGELLGPIGNPRYAEYAKDVLNSGQHLLQIINDLLDLSKLEAGKQELHQTQVSISQLAEDSLRLVSERASHASVKLELEVPPELPDLHADERRLKQILLNLLSNAVKFTPSGGRVTIRAAASGDGGIELSVVDTGVGMSAEEIRVALSPFGQVDGSFARKHQGTGLGLPLARSLAELHGGTLAVESAPDAGTTVSLRLPSSCVLGS